jgi:hypothetical protein
MVLMQLQLNVKYRRIERRSPWRDSHFIIHMVYDVLTDHIQTIKFETLLTLSFHSL